MSELSKEKVKKRLSDNWCVCPYAKTMEVKGKIKHILSKFLGKEKKDKINDKSIHYLNIDENETDIDKIKNEAIKQWAIILTDHIIDVYQKIDNIPKNILSEIIENQKLETEVITKNLIYESLLSKLQKENSWLVNISKEKNENLFMVYMWPIYKSQHDNKKENFYSKLHWRRAPSHIISTIPFDTIINAAENDTKTYTYIKQKVDQNHDIAWYNKYSTSNFFVNP